MNKRIKCPWCGRIINIKNDRYVVHIQSPKVKCVGSGVKLINKEVV